MGNFYTSPGQVKKFIKKLKKRITDLEDRNSRLQQRVLNLTTTFEHIHVNDPDTDNDICATCGLDLRNQIHTRSKS